MNQECVSPGHRALAILLALLEIDEERPENRLGLAIWWDTVRPQVDLLRKQARLARTHAIEGLQAMDPVRDTYDLSSTRVPYCRACFAFHDSPAGSESVSRMREWVIRETGGAFPL